MNREELRSILLSRGVSRSYYSLEGGLPNEKLCLDCKKREMDCLTLRIWIGAGGVGLSAMKMLMFTILLMGVPMGMPDFDLTYSNSDLIAVLDGNAAMALKTASDEFIKACNDPSRFNVTIYRKERGDIEDESAPFVVTFMGKLALGKRGLGTANRVKGSITYFVSVGNWKIVYEQGVR